MDKKIIPNNKKQMNFRDFILIVEKFLSYLIII